MTVIIDDLKILVNGEEACRILSMSRNSLSRAVQMGEIIPTRIGASGRGVRFRLSELRRFAESRSGVSATELATA